MNTKLLLEVAENMRSLADSIQAFCEAGKSEEPPETFVKEEPAAAPEKEEKPIPMETVRGILADKSREGHTAEVRAIIQKHGADRLSGLDPKDYASVISEAEALS